MKKLKIYLDTSIINFLVVDDSPEYRRETEIFFANVVSTNKVDTYISKVVTEEINNTKDINLRNILFENLNNYKNIMTLLPDDIKANEINILAEKYIKHRIIPERKLADALHIAYAAVFEMDILLSWNFKHLANINKEQQILIINKLYGYNYPFRMANPLEVQYNE
jgi:hypothetical protein